MLTFDELASHLIRHRKDLAAAKIGTNNLTSHLNASFHHLSAIDPHDLSGIAPAIFIDEAQTKSGPRGKKPQALHGFRPERLRGAAITPFNVIPQRGGGGSLTKPPFPPRKDFDCADADRDILLARQMCYALPRQNLNVDFKRLPALPRSGTILSDVQIRTSDSTNSH